MSALGNEEACGNNGMYMGGFKQNIAFLCCKMWKFLLQSMNAKGCMWIKLRQTHGNKTVGMNCYRQEAWNYKTEIRLMS